MHNIGQSTRSCFRNFFTVKTLKKRIPIIEWLPKYRFNLFIQDFIAGISVGLTAIPQGIAYAGVAGLPLAVIKNNDFCMEECNKIIIF